jgi:exonuclease SbcC
LSGGEQMSAALAVRLALVREMSSINVAFFDEPTANLDGVRREALANQIMTVRGFNQLFVISHDDTFEQATQNLIRVTRHGNTTAIGDTAE